MPKSRHTAPAPLLTLDRARSSQFTASDLAALRFAGASAEFCRSLLASFSSRDEWLSAPLLPGEHPGLRSSPPYTPTAGEQVLGCMDPSYPSYFFDLDDPPPVLFLLGRAEFRPSVGVVGSRSVSRFGSKVASIAASSAVSAGACVLSGLAAGVDSRAHEEALTAGGTSSAFVPSLSALSPVQEDLASRLIHSGGFLCAEHPSGLAVEKNHYISRNRLIAALSYPLVPVEGELFSGTASALRFAAALGRPILVATPRPAYRSIPTAALPLTMALSPIAAAARLGPGMVFKNVSPTSPTAANAVCGTPEDLEECLKVLFWLHRA